MLLETVSVDPTKALQTNSTSASFTVPQPLTIRPDQPPTPGFFEAGGIGVVSPNRVWLAPYATGAAGAQFSVRVFAWRHMGNPAATSTLEEWLPFLLVELLCTTGTASGLGSRYVNNTENFCEVISLTRGNLGPWYSAIYSPGSGTGLAGQVLIDLTACDYYSFDFARVTGGIGMNCLQARA